MDYYCLQGISACFEPGFLVRLCKTKKMATPDIMLQVRPEHRVNISFSNVSFQYPAKKKEDIARCGDGFFGFVTNLVKTCYAQHQFQYTAGKIQAGELTAIMGPSGAGKSTFWKALTAHQSGLQLSGNAAVNGEFVSSVLGSVRSLYGYVPQTDILDRDATVEENIRFQAETRLPAAYTEAQVDELVEWLLHHFSIDELRDKTIGEVGSENLSGGQIKRVSLAMEIAARPSLMFLDEPTSGLDSTTTEIVVKTLRGLADGGANILVIIHQPSDSVFNQFDRLILLNTDSHIAYMGARADAVEYFRGLLIEADEPPPACGEADFLMDILSRNKCKKVCMVVFFKMLSNQYVGHSSYLCIDAAEAAVCKKNESSSSSFSSSSSSSSSSPYQLGS
jgi:ABC-type multidrug transport system ATPase subunit